MWKNDDLFLEQFEKCIGEFYVINENTHELVYISDAIKNMKSESGQKEICYKALHSRETPCPFCPKKLKTLAPEFVDSYTSDSYVSNEKKWFQYKMLSYSAENEIYRIVLRYEAEPMMGLNREAIQQLVEYQKSFQKDVKIKKKLSYDATHDGMTALYNRGKYFYDVSQLKEKNEVAGIIVCDVNNLKQINDSYGHMLGDKIISCFADILKSIEDENNKCYRIGGDEFVVLRKNSDEETLKRTALTIDEEIEKQNDIALSIALGWAVCLPRETFEEAFNRADRQMYIRKTKMKNKDFNQYKSESQQRATDI